MQAELWRRPTVGARTGLSTSELYRLIREGEFPKQVKYDGGKVAWVSTEVQAWIDERIARARAA